MVTVLTSGTHVAWIAASFIAKHRSQQMKREMILTTCTVLV